MKKLLFVLTVASAFSTTALAVDIAISTKSGWWGQGALTRKCRTLSRM